MATLNKVMLIGNLTRDPVLRYTPKGNAVADIRLAVNRYYTLESGEKREETTFIDVVLWSRQAELVNQYLSKGRPIFIEGRLQLDQWEDKETGEPRSKIRVVCENMQFLGSPQGSKPAPKDNEEKSKDSPKKEQENKDDNDEFVDEGDDIPF